MNKDSSNDRDGHNTKIMKVNTWYKPEEKDDNTNNDKMMKDC